MERKRYIDLHTHTKYSDGIAVEPGLIVRTAILNHNIDILAITDHDYSIAYDLVKEDAKRFGIILLPGAEITTSNYHLLSLNFNPNDECFQQFLKHSRDLQKQRCEKRVNKLAEHGVPITIDKVVQEFPESRLGKFNAFVTMLIDDECRRFMDKDTPGMITYDRFRHYLGRGGIVGKVGGDVSVSDEETINAVHNAGGVIGLAHPPKDINLPSEISRLDKLVEQGIDFLEIQPLFKDEFPYHLFEEYAEKRGIPISYGSDYHGPTFYRAMLGRGENVLSPELGRLLNKGYIKIPNLENVCC